MKKKPFFINFFGLFSIEIEKFKEHKVRFRIFREVIEEEGIEEGEELKTLPSGNGKDKANADRATEQKSTVVR